MDQMKLINNLINYFPVKTQNLLKCCLFPFLRRKNQPIFSIIIEKNKNNDQEKTALLSYITAPFRLKKPDYQQITFSNTGIAKSIVRVLNRLGYIVDVVEYTDTKFIPTKNYDLFIGHGGFNFRNVVGNLGKRCTKIYFSAGPYWRFWNRKEKERIDALRKRRNVIYPYERLDVSEDKILRRCDAIVALGNKIVYDSYRDFPNVYTLNNAAYPDDHFEKTAKDFKKAKNNFLFFAGGGNVHKGLDLLLEAFKEIKAHLYICQTISPDFYRIYKHELEDYSNIHFVSWVSLRSPKYYEIVDKCTFLIYPSCADGSPGAVIESLHQGLIPILSKEATVDTDGFGITLKNNSVEEIIKTVNYLSYRSADWCRLMSKKTREVARKQYSETAFLQNLEKIIKKIIKQKSH